MKNRPIVYQRKEIPYQAKHVISGCSIYVLMLVIFLMSMIGILLIEYRFFCIQSQKMIALQKQYKHYLGIVKKIANKSMINGKLQASAMHNRLTYSLHDSKKKEIGNKPANFLIVNRRPEHLKKTTFEYFKIQQLDSLLMNIDQQELLDYSSQIMATFVSKDNRVAKRKLKKQNQSEISCLWPIDRQSFWLSSLFGPRKKVDGSWGFHYGIDMAAMKGTPVKAAHTGSVIEAGFMPGYGNTIVIQYNNNFKTRYAHLENIYVTKDQKIKKGKYIGTVGDTGFIRKSGKDGSHLHFEVYKNGKQINPLYSLPAIC